MSCEICGRGACTRSFHSAEAQAHYEAKQAMSDDVDELRDEVLALQSRIEELSIQATPSVVVADHPKCGTCDLMRIGPHVTSEPYCLYRSAVDPALDYCRHHSELNKENDDDKTYG